MYMLDRSNTAGQEVIVLDISPLSHIKVYISRNQTDYTED